MSKSAIPSAPQPKRTASGKVVKLKKHTSHGTYRCKRKPNSKRCKNVCTNEKYSVHSSDTLSRTISME